MRIPEDDRPLEVARPDRDERRVPGNQLLEFGEQGVGPGRSEAEDGFR